MAEIINIKNEAGEVQYPVTKPECVIDENGKNVLQLIRENGSSSSYDDTEIKQQLIELSAEKEDKTNKVTSLTEESTDEQYPSAKAVYALSERISENEILIEDLQENKADVSGYYPQLSVGQADNLPDRGDVTEGLIGFRESAGAGNSIEDGTANVVELLGESLVWNQLRLDDTFEETERNGVTISLDGQCVVLNGTANANTSFKAIKKTAVIKGHQYLISGGESNLASYNFYDNSLIAAVGQQNTIFTALESGVVLEQRIYCITGKTFNNYRIEPRLIDLTKMFGAGNEPTIEEFEAIKNQLVGVDFNAHNEGEVLGVNIKGIKSVNDNAFNGEYAKVLGGREYCADGTITSMGFTREIGGTTEVIVLDSENKFTPTENGYVYASGTDICIHLVHTGYKDHVYTEHEVSESSFDLTPYFPNGMHGINGVGDSVTKSKATMRIGVVDMGSLDWMHDATNYRFYTNELISFIKKPSSGWGRNLLCAKYDSIIWESTLDKFVTVLSSGRIYVKDSAYTDATTFKAAMQGVMLYYELDTPIETEIDPQLNMNYKVWDFGTEELLTDSKSAPVLARTIYGFNATDTIRGNKEKIKNNEERIRELESEAVRGDDYQPNLSVGLADNLSGVDVVDSEVNFRRSGGGAISDGVARIEAIKGNSVVWNQIFGKGSGSAGTWEGNILTINGSYASEWTSYDIAKTGALFIAPTLNHKYFVSIEILSGTLIGNITYVVYPALPYTRVVLNESNKSFAAIITEINDVNTYKYWLFRTYSEGSEFANVKVRHIIHDLTKMFGAGNEPTTIEEFYQRIPMGVDLNAYNEGEVIHMDVQSLESQGVNAWDEQWEKGSINIADGVNIQSTQAIRNKNYIKVLPNQGYYFKMPTSYRFVFYDEQKKHISGDGKSTNQVITTPSNCHYLKFSVGTNNNPITTYNHDICINISDTSINGKYFPYIKRAEDSSIIRKYFPNGMKSAGTAHDEIRYNKATQKWEMVQRIGVVDMGTLAWGYNNSVGNERLFTLSLTDVMQVPNTETKGGLLTTLYSAASFNNIYSHSSDKLIGLHTNGQLVVYDSAYTDAATFKAAMSGVILYYELAEPIVTELDAEDQFKDLDYQVWNCGTEKAIAEGKSAPLAADITYGFNAIGKIKELESLVAALRAKVGI